MADSSSYRPHDPGHDYYEPGIYLITLVVRNRTEQPTVLGRLGNDLRHPGVELSEVGMAVMDCWARIPEFQARKGRQVEVLNAVCMPDHFHGVIAVKARMDKSLGEVIRGFKAGCSMAWREKAREKARIEARKEARKEERPNMVTPMAASGVGAALPYLEEQPELSREALMRLSKKQRAEYYAQRAKEEQPLWDDNYDDTICIDEEHLQRMLHYVDDNPRRAMIRRARPQFMQRCLHVIIDGRDYAAFGNLFLLRWARKLQVFCHRKARYGQLTDEDKQTFGIRYDATPEFITDIAYETTRAYAAECETWTRQIMAGQTVIVTPGISKGEQGMKDTCIERGFPLIHLQKEPIGSYWKPEARRFEACARGSLLILAPWETDGDSDYAIFHNLNTLAEEICRFDGEARIVDL